VNRILIVSVLAAGAFLSSCAKDDYARTEGISLGVGDAVAVNTALQVIDPWPEGVEDTDLTVPSDRGGEGGATPGTPAPAATPNP
jgi:hypothetical protein